MVRETLANACTAWKPSNGPRQGTRLARVRHRARTDGASMAHLPRVGPHERHPAVAQAHVRDLHRDGDATGQHHLMAPVELAGLARLEASRQRRASRATARRPPTPRRCPAASTPPHGAGPRHARRRSRAPAVGAFLGPMAERPSTSKIREPRHPLAAAPRDVRSQQPIQFLRPRPELRPRLHGALVFEGRLVRAQNLPPVRRGARTGGAPAPHSATASARGRSA
jgi:hypothetical protein